MRLGRLILASLTALAAYAYAQNAPHIAGAPESLRLLQTVVPLFVHSADSAPATPAVPSAGHATLTLEALTATPLGGSLCLVASLIAIDFLARRHQRNLLRC